MQIATELNRLHQTGLAGKLSNQVAGKPVPDYVPWYLQLKNGVPFTIVSPHVTPRYFFEGRAVQSKQANKA